MPDEDSAPAQDARAAAIETLQRELTALSRRARGVAARMHPELSLVAYTLLSHLEDRQGATATELAAHYALDKSTVSRQVTALERSGLVERRVPAHDHRVQVLHPTDAGTELLRQARRSRNETIGARLAEWPEDDLVRFAAYLVRYNDEAALD